MSDNRIVNKNIEVTFTHKDNKVTFEGNYWRNINPYNDEEIQARKELLSKFSSLPKEGIEKLLVTHHAQEQTKKEEIMQLMLSLTEEVSQVILLEHELSIIKRIDAIKAFFETSEDTFNKVTRETKDNRINVSITNGIYTLKIWASKGYRKNYDIGCYLVINNNFEIINSQYGNTIESFQNNSYSDITKVETYINNKLKKYNHLFTIKKAIMKKDVEKYKIHPRIIKELGIKVFETPEEILNAIK